MTTRSPLDSTAPPVRRLAAGTLLLLAATGCNGNGANPSPSGSATPSATASASASAGGSPSVGPTGATAGATSTGRPTASASATAAALPAALDEAFRAETRALATYRNVLQSLGQVAPFVNVSRAEEQHVSTVRALYSRHGLTAPAAATGEASPATLRAACQLGVQVEEQVVSLYQRLLPTVQAYRDAVTAFTNLLDASRDDHLPAFQHCT